MIKNKIKNKKVNAPSNENNINQKKGNVLHYEDKIKKKKQYDGGMEMGG